MSVAATYLGWEMEQILKCHEFIFYKLGTNTLLRILNNILILFPERYAELQDFIKRNVGPGHTCLICGKECKFVHAVQYHIESAHGKHFNVTYQCEICNKTVDTKNAFITHKSRHHKKGSLGPFLNMC